MDQGPYESVPEPERLWKRMLAIIAAGYAIDGLLLTLFAFAGVIPIWDPAAYVATGIASCALFFALIASGFSARFADSNMTLAQLGLAVLVQLTWMILVPVASMYHVTILFVIFGFASLRLRPLEALGAWTAVAVLLGMIFMLVPQAVTIPHETAYVRMLVGATICLALGKCTMLGLYSSRLRVMVGRRFEATKASLQVVESRNVAVATSLHEGLGQELTGISLLLTALGARLRREGHPGAEDVSQATEHVCAAIQTSRALADSIRPAPSQFSDVTTGTIEEIRPQPYARSPANHPRQRDRRHRSHT